MNTSQKDTLNKKNYFRKVSEDLRNIVNNNYSNENKIELFIDLFNEYIEEIKSNDNNIKKILEKNEIDNADDFKNFIKSLYKNNSLLSYNDFQKIIENLKNIFNVLKEKFFSCKINDTEKTIGDKIEMDEIQKNMKDNIKLYKRIQKIMKGKESIPDELEDSEGKIEEPLGRKLAKFYLYNKNKENKEKEIIIHLENPEKEYKKDINSFNRDLSIFEKINKNLESYNESYKKFKKESKITKKINIFLADKYKETAFLLKERKKAILPIFNKYDYSIKKILDNINEEIEKDKKSIIDESLKEKLNNIYNIRNSLKLEPECDKIEEIIKTKIKEITFSESKEILKNILEEIKQIKQINNLINNCNILNGADKNENINKIYKKHKKKLRTFLMI